MIHQPRSEKHQITDGQASRIILKLLDCGGVRWHREKGDDMFFYFAERSFLHIKPGHVCFSGLPERIKEEVKLILEGKK